MTLLTQATFQAELSTGPELPNFGAIALLIVLLVVGMLILKRIARRFRRRERETLERATWAQVGVFPTTRIFRKWNYGHRRTGRIRRRR